MKRYILILLLTAYFFPAHAHQVDLSSTMLIEQEDGNWILQVRSALTAFEYAVHDRFGQAAYDSPEGFQALVAQHLQDHIMIHFNTQPQARLQKPYVRLGHETYVLFEIPNVPEHVKQIKLSNTSFEQISQSQSALIVLKKGFLKDQFTLNHANQYSMLLKAKANRFESCVHKKDMSPLRIGFFFLGAAFFLVIGGGILWKKAS